jgi:GDP-L-fucose synthase
MGKDEYSSIYRNLFKSVMEGNHQIWNTNNIENKKKILVTGGSGLVGKHLKKYFKHAIFISSKDYDLTKENEVIKMYNDHKPEIVIHLAAKVGGIIDNILHPAEYFTENVLMNTLLIKYAHLNNVERFLGILSTCIYPDVAEKYPLNEDDLHTGPPTETNFSYGYAKRLMAVQIDSYNKQYGTRYNYLTPCNLYGENDKDNEIKSHFVTALIKKIYEANLRGDNEITLFGDGSPIRQFLHADDFARIIYEMVENEIYENFNVANDETYTIKKIAEIALEATDSTNLKIIFDTTKPNGQLRKDVSNKKLKSLFPNFNFLFLGTGIKQVYENYGKISK